MSNYTVVGYFIHPHKDCEAESQDCETYQEALLLKEEWKKLKKYKYVYIETY